MTTYRIKFEHVGSEDGEVHEYWATIDAGDPLEAESRALDELDRVFRTGHGYRLVGTHDMPDNDKDPGHAGV